MRVERTQSDLFMLPFDIASASAETARWTAAFPIEYLNDGDRAWLSAVEPLTGEGSASEIALRGVVQIGSAQQCRRHEAGMLGSVNSPCMAAGFEKLVSNDRDALDCRNAEASFLEIDGIYGYHKNN
jgi:hypothetical protein